MIVTPVLGRSCQLCHDQATPIEEHGRIDTPVPHEEDSPIPKRIFVGNLPFDTTPDRLRGALEPAGEIVDLHIVTDRETGRSRGFAFAEYSSDEQAEQAIQILNDQEFDGRKLRVNAAEDRPQRGPGGPGGPRPPGAGRPRPTGGGGGDSGFGGGGGGDAGMGDFSRPKGSRRGMRGRKRSLGR